MPLAPPPFGLLSRELVSQGFTGSAGWLGPQRPHSVGRQGDGDGECGRELSPRHPPAQVAQAINRLSSGCVPEPNAEVCYLNFKITSSSNSCQRPSVTEHRASAVALSITSHTSPSGRVHLLVRRGCGWLGRTGTAGQEEESVWVDGAG